MYAGIDFSLNCPCIAVSDINIINFEDCQFYYSTINKKFQYDVENIHGTVQLGYCSEEERFLNLTEWAIKTIGDSRNIGLEGYAYAAKGRVFSIAEATGLLKNALWLNEIETDIITPTEVKKFATGKGNASKELMEEVFTKETGVDLRTLLRQTKKQNSPSGDIIDSYYILKCLVNRMHMIKGEKK